MTKRAGPPQKLYKTTPDNAVLRCYEEYETGGRAVTAYLTSP